MFWDNLIKSFCRYQNFTFPNFASIFEWMVIQPISSIDYCKVLRQNTPKFSNKNIQSSPAHIDIMLTSPMFWEKSARSTKQNSISRHIFSDGLVQLSGVIFSFSNRHILRPPYLSIRLWTTHRSRPSEGRCFAKTRLRLRMAFRFWLLSCRSGYLRKPLFVNDFYHQKTTLPRRIYFREHDVLPFKLTEEIV